MPSGFIQLLAVGSERQYLHDNPHISFFKGTYRRYTNFFINTEELVNNEIFENTTSSLRKSDINNTTSTITNAPDQVINFNIPKKGDLLSKYYLKINISDNYNELLKYYENVNNTIIDNITDFYNDYTITKYIFDKFEIKLMDIVKIQFKENKLSQSYFTLESTYLAENSETITYLIKLNINTFLELDSEGVFYNLNFRYLFFSFIAYETYTNLFEIDYFKLIIETINFNKLNFMRVDVGDKSWKIYNNNADFFKVIFSFMINLISNDYRMILQINEYDIYFKIYENNLDIAIINQVNIFLSQTVLTNNINLTIIYDKINSKNFIVDLERYNILIKNIAGQKTVYFEVYTPTIILDSDNINLSSQETEVTVYILTNNIYFGNYDNNDFNQKLIQYENDFYNLSNLNTTSNFSLITYIRLIINIFNYESPPGEIDIIKFLKLMENTNVSEIVKYYVSNTNFFYQKYMDIIVDQLVYIFNIPSFRSLIFDFNIYKSTNNYINNNFINKKKTSFGDTIISYNLYKNIFYNTNFSIFKLINITDTLIGNSITYNYSNIFNVDISTQIFSQLYNNYLYNNNLFPFITENATVDYLITPIINAGPNLNVQLILFIIFNIVSLTLSSIDVIQQISTDVKLIYNTSGNYTQLMREYEYSISIFPLSSYLSTYIRQPITDSTGNQIGLENITGITYNITKNNYLTNINEKLINIYNSLYKKYTTSSIDSSFNVNDIQAQNANSTILQNTILGKIDKYYTRTEEILEKINMQELQTIFGFFGSTSSLTYEAIFKTFDASSIQILTNIFKYFDQKLFNDSFSAYFRNTNYGADPTTYETHKYYSKFIFLDASPFYRILFFLGFLCRFKLANEDIVNLSQFTIEYLQAFFNFDIGTYPTKNEYTLPRPNLEPELQPQNNFLCYDKLNILMKSDFNTFLQKNDNIDTGTYGDNFAAYVNFYFKKNYIYSLLLGSKTIDQSTRDALLKQIFAYTKYNYDDSIFNNYIDYLNINSNYFDNIDNINILINYFFSKNENIATLAEENIFELKTLVASFMTQYNQDYVDENFSLFSFFKFRALNIGWYFDNNYQQNVSTINEYYNSYINNDYYSEIVKLYAVQTYDIKRYNNFVDLNNLVNIYNDYRTLFYTINNFSNINNFDLLFNDLIEGLYKYLMFNFNYINNYIIDEISFNTCLSTLNNYVNKFNTINGTNVNLYNYLPNKLNTYKNYISNYKIIVLYILYISFIKQCMYLDLRKFVNDANLNKITFEDYVNLKYETELYLSILNDLINITASNNKYLNLDYSQLNLYYINYNIKGFEEDLQNNYPNINTDTKILNPDQSPDLELGLIIPKTYYNYYFLPENILIGIPYVLFITNYNCIFFNNIQQLLNNIIEQTNNYLFVINNSNLFKIPVEYNIENSLIQNNNKNKNLFYNSAMFSTTGIQKLHDYLKKYYEDNIYILQVNASIINSILDEITKFYKQEEKSYFNNYYKILYYKSDVEISDSGFSTKKEDISVYVNKFFNNKIFYSIFLEKEINRFLYYYMTQYVIGIYQSYGLNYDDIFNFINQNTLYNFVKMYACTYANASTKIYEQNLFIYQNQEVLELLNINFVTDVQCAIQNSYVLDFISTLSTVSTDENSYYNFYKYFYNFVTKSDYKNLIYTDLLLIDGTNVYDYFLNIDNVEELNQYIYNFFVLKEYYSPIQIYSKIISYRYNPKNDNIDVNLFLERDNILKKIIVYLYVIYLIYVNLPIIINNNLNLRESYYLEYTINEIVIKFRIKDALNNFILRDLKKFIYEFYEIDKNIPFFNNLYNYEYSDAYIINVINKNIENITILNYFDLCVNYIDSYKYTIYDYTTDTTCNLCLTNSICNTLNDPRTGCLIKKELYNLNNLVIDINNYINFTKINYGITIFTAISNEVYFGNEIYDLNKIDENKNINLSSIYEYILLSYDKTDIYNLNVFFIIFIIILQYYNVYNDNVDNYISYIMSFTRTDKININETFENLKGFTDKINLNSDFVEPFLINLNIPEKPIGDNIFITRTLNNKILSQMINSFGNYSLITPIDYNYENTFANFNKIYATGTFGENNINIYKKFYNYKYNYYEYSFNYIKIYQNKLQYYNKILEDVNNLINIKNNYINYYLELFTDIIVTKYAVEFFNFYIVNNADITQLYKMVVNSDPSYYVPLFNELINLYLNCNFQFYINPFIPNYNNLFNYNAIIKLSNNLTTLPEQNTYITNLYFFQLFGVLLKDYNPKTSQKDFLQFIEGISEFSNYNFNYFFYKYNFVYKLQLLTTLILQNYENLLNIDFELDSQEYDIVFDNIILKFSEKNRMIEYIYLYELKNFLNIKEFDNLVSLLSDSIANLLYNNSNTNYDDTFSQLYFNYFDNICFTRIRYDSIINDYYCEKVKITKDEVAIFFDQYIFYIITRENYTFVNNIYFGIYKYIEVIINNIFSKNADNTNSNLITICSDLQYRDAPNYITKYIMEIINNNYWGFVIADYNNYNNNTLLDIKIKLLNYYFMKISFFNISDTFVKQQSDSLTLLYKIKIYMLLTINVTFENTINIFYTDIIVNSILKSYKVLYNGVYIKCLKIEDSVVIYNDFINNNILPLSNLNNYFKNTSNNTIYEIINYNIYKFVVDYPNNNLNNLFNYIYGNSIFSNQEELTETFIGQIFYTNYMNNIFNNVGTQLILIIDNKQILISNIISYFVNNVKLYLEEIKQIFGGDVTFNTNLYISIDDYINFFSKSISRFEDNSINIYTLIYNNFNNELVLTNYIFVVILFYNICLTIYIFNKGNLYGELLQNITLYLANLIYRNIYALLNNSQDPEIILFFDTLNKFLVKYLTDAELTVEIIKFFDTLGNVNDILRNIKTESQIVDFILKTASEESFKNNENIINLIKKVNFNDNAVLNKYIKNNKVNLWKNILVSIVDITQSNMIKDFKSMMCDSTFNIQQLYMEQLLFISKTYVSEYGIISLVNKFQLFFSTQLTDTLYQEMFKIYYTLFQNLNKISNLDQFYGIDDFSYLDTGLKPYIKVIRNKDFYIPNYFYFSNYINSIPLICCMYMDVYVKLYLKNKSIIKNFYTPVQLKSNNKISMIVDYIYLEKEERARLTRRTCDNLINVHLIGSQNQIITFDSLNNSDMFLKIDFFFSLPNMVKELFWTVDFYINDFLLDPLNIINTDFINNNEQNFYDFIYSTVLFFDGSKRDGIQIQQLKNYSQINRNIDQYKYHTRADNKNIYNVYSFAFKPEDFQPTGAVNLSKINNLQIQLILNNQLVLTLIQRLEKFIKVQKVSATLKLWATGYNIMRYQAGIAGLLFTK